MTKENPTFGIDRKPVRPKTLGELYELVVKLYPTVNHNEEEFFNLIIKQLGKDPLRNDQLKSQTEKEHLYLKFEKHWPLNDFERGAANYLKSLGVQEEEISKFWDIVLNF